MNKLLILLTNRRLGVTEAIKTGLLNSNITIYNHPVKQQQLTILEAYEQGLIIGKFRDQNPSSFIGDQREQIFYLITSVIDIRTDKVYNLQEGIQQKLFDHKKGVYIHPITGDEINIGDAVKRGFIQVQAVSSQINLITNKFNVNVSNNIEYILNHSFNQNPIHQAHHVSRRSQILQSEKEIIEIESIQRVPRHRRHIIQQQKKKLLNIIQQILLIKKYLLIVDVQLKDHNKNILKKLLLMTDNKKSKRKN